MRILTVSHFYESHGGGIERVAGQLCRRFVRQGAQPSWCASDVDPAPADRDVEAVPLACLDPAEKLTGLPMPLPGPRAVLALWRAVGAADAVVIHDALYVTSIVALLAAKARRKRTVLIQHIAGIPFSAPLLRAVMRWANRLVTQPMLRAADEVVFISDTVRRDLLGDGPCRSFRLAFNGVDGALFHPAPDAERPAVVATIDCPAAARKVLFVGRFVEKKGLSVLRALAGARPDLAFFLAGSGPIDPHSWGLPNVHVLGPQSPATLAALYRWADMLLLPSVGEGYPLVVQEAMACGLPVICGAPTHRADPDAADWLCGVEIDLRDPQGSAARCVKALDAPRPDAGRRQIMARWAGQRYDWDAMAATVLAAARQRG